MPGVQNYRADFLSREHSINLEWKLNPSVFRRITQTLFMPDIDLFASRLNCQLPRFASWQPDPRHVYLTRFLPLGHHLLRTFFSL